MVEFALAIPFLLVLAMGVIEFGRLMFSYSAVVSAAREAARECREVPCDVIGAAATDRWFRARVAELVDAPDSKSGALHWACGFDPTSSTKPARAR